MTTPTIKCQGCDQLTNVYNLVIDQGKQKLFCQKCECDYEVEVYSYGWELSPGIVKQFTTIHS